MEQNLWGDFPLVPKITAPITILKAQAALLQEITGGAVVGEIQSVQPILLRNAADAISHEFRIVAPSLNNYRIRVLRLEHRVISYPCKIGLLFGQGNSVQVIECEDEGALVDGLKSVLSDDALKSAIVTLVAQVNASE